MENELEQRIYANQVVIYNLLQEIMYTLKPESGIKSLAGSKKELHEKAIEALIPN